MTKQEFITKFYSESSFDPATCSLEELEEAIAQMQHDKIRQAYFRGAQHARITLAAAGVRKAIL